MDELKITSTEWNLTPLFSSDDDLKMVEDRKKTESTVLAFANKWKNRKDYTEDPAILKQALDDFESLQKNTGIAGMEGFYFFLRSHQDETNPALKARVSKSTEFSKNLLNEIRFFELTLTTIPKEKQEEFLGFPPLAPYKHYLERIFTAAQYVLSEPEEKILTLKSEVSYHNWTRMVSGFLAKEEREVLNENKENQSLSFSDIQSLTQSTDKETRDTAADAMNSILQAHVEAAEAEMNSVLENRKIDDELRGYPRPDSVRHVRDDIETEVVDTLVTAVSDRFDIPQRFYALKAKLLGLPRLAYHERNVPYGEIDATVSYGESVQLVYKVVSDIDPKFGKLFKAFVEEGRIDALPKKGKHNGAFCVHDLLVEPTYILLNHTGKARDVATLAHEFGHGANAEIMKEVQNALNFGTSMATAEVASTFMEDFVLREFAQHANDETKLALNMMKLGDEISTIFRQIACYQFEWELHAEYRKQGYLSKEQIGTIFHKHMAAYMGDAVEQSTGSENWWVYWSHIRTYFYVYSYASGLLISKSMQNSVRENHEFIEKVKEFFSLGSSESPKNQFARLGIDVTSKEFWNKGLNEIDQLLIETESLAQKLGKI